MDEPGSSSAGENEWLEVRRFLQQNRFALGVEAADDFPDHPRFPGTPLLGRADWMPPAPIPLTDVRLAWDDAPAPIPSSAEYGAVLPAGYANYSDVYRRLAAPPGLANRPTYRLRGADLSGPAALLTFGDGRYFDGLDAGEASAHAYAARKRGLDGGSIRKALDDPCDLDRRGANLGVSALVLRRGAAGAEFLLHWRDPAKVSHAGGLFQVVPSGVFQASGPGAWNHDADFSLVRFLVREFAEELGGRSEVYDNGTRAIDYDGWPFARDFAGHLAAGRVRAWCVGLGVDPLTFATDLLAVFVFDAGAFDELFDRVAIDNDEGRVLAGRPFTEAEVRHFVGDEPMQAAGAALLSGAWRHRELLLTDAG